ncbi:replication-associated [Paramuricea clavata]|uniref:Replication-associated n=1 Tax=Paramuricea clavata TaxID=317549 RepID=A0A6S7H5W0_PARCT|nr:replication-associated [Paramuricea clavata]
MTDENHGVSSGTSNHFINTRGGWDSNSNEVPTWTGHIMIAKHITIPQTINSNGPISTDLSDILGATGNSPALFFQSYRVNSVTAYIQGFHIDNDDAARAHVNMWLAPWNRPFYIGGTGVGLTAINTNAKCLPGSTWRQFNVPSLLYSTQANTGDISANGMLSNTMAQPMYEINTAQDAATHGDVMANGMIPTLNPGTDNPAPFYDNTPWQCFIFEIETIFGAATVSDASGDQLPMITSPTAPSRIKQYPPIRNMKRQLSDLSGDEEIPMLTSPAPRPTRPGWSGNNEVEERIYDMIIKGHRMFKDILPLYPKYYATIARLMICRKPRDFITHVLQIFGPAGIGKTTAVFKVLKAFTDTGVADFYFKGGGLKKYWDGYDNQPIVWIDDPVTLDASRDSESVQQLKNVFSTGNAVVEVKYGSLTFDSKLVIITSNGAPEYLAASCGEENYEPILRRLTDTCGRRFCH